MKVQVKLRFAHVGAQKARLVADRVRGCNVHEALRRLALMPQKTAPMLKKMLKAAVSRADDQQVIDTSQLYIKKLCVDEGPSMKRFMPRAKGAASRIRKKRSHIHMVLAEKGD